VPKLKAHLAAGWVVVIAASQPIAVHTSPGLNTYGAVVAPPLGSKRQGQGGHAWTLVGYDHVDGNAQWKYQGHFLAMTSWGDKFPIKQPLGPGVVAIPFSFFLSEGFEAWAFRFSY
jgi:C1A family cysteine protease